MFIHPRESGTGLEANTKDLLSYSSVFFPRTELGLKVPGQHREGRQ